MAALGVQEGYRRLDPAQIILTAERLEQRIAERFPDRGLKRVAEDLVALAREVAAKSEQLKQPLWAWRILTALVIAAGAAALLYVGSMLSFNRIATDEAFGFVQGIEASLNTILIAGVGVLALTGIEKRRKRAAVSTHLYALRSLIHVIDMHQLTKDPSVVVSSAAPTASSPPRTITGFALARYLDYCSEMLSLTNKLAALYAQNLPDAVVVEAVNDIERLTTNLSSKIWQKITILDARGS